jgi:hypothetical protein
VRYRPTSQELVAEARRMRLQGESWHRIAYILKLNPMDAREAVTGVTFANLLDPPPVPDPEGTQYPAATMGSILGTELFTKTFGGPPEPEVKVAFKSKKTVSRPRPKRSLPRKRTVSKPSRRSQGKLETAGPRRVKKRFGDEQHAQIRQRYATGETRRSLAAEYGVTQGAIRTITEGVTKTSGHPWVRLTVAQKEQIRAQYATGTTRNALAAEHNIALTTVRRVVKGVRRANHPAKEAAA